MTVRCLGFSALAAFAIAGVCVLAGCQDEHGRIYSESRFCPGAYAPGSEVCWEPNDGGEEGQLSADFAAAEENGARFAGMTTRCTAGIGDVPGTPGTLSVTFTTVKLGGKYAPRNCGAVWIEDSLGFYVRTLELWAGERAASVVAWHLSRCDMDKKVMDVVTSATLDGPTTHMATWDSRDYKGNLVADGTYNLWLQVTENEIFPEGPFVTIPIVKGPQASTFDPKEATRGFDGIKVTYTPPGAGVAQATAP